MNILTIGDIIDIVFSILLICSIIAFCVTIKASISSIEKSVRIKTFAAINCIATMIFALAKLLLHIL